MLLREAQTLGTARCINECTVWDSPWILCTVLVVRNVDSFRPTARRPLLQRPIKERQRVANPSMNTPYNSPVLPRDYEVCELQPCRSIL